MARIPIATGQTERAEVAVPLTAAVSVSVTAQQMLDGFDESSIEQALVQKLPTTLQSARVAFGQEQASGSNPVADLAQSGPIWKGTLRSLATHYDATADRQLRAGVDPELRNSTGGFLVDMAPESGRADRIQSIVAGLLLRMQQVCGRPELEELMANWRKWLPKVEGLTVADIAGVRSVYEDGVKIPTRQLLDLVSDVPEVRSAALKEVEEGGGFLRDFDSDAIREVLENGVGDVLRRDGRIMGYYGVITDARRVLEHMKREYGFEWGITYTLENLPTHVVRDGRQFALAWTNRHLGLQMFQNLHRLALSVEIAVANDSGDQSRGLAPTRQSGVATALKFRTYSRIPREKPLIFIKHFEITGVDGRPVPSAVNRGSRRFIETLGGRLVGTVEDGFTRTDPDTGRIIPVELLWHLYLASVKESLAVMEGLGQVRK